MDDSEVPSGNAGNAGCAYVISIATRDLLIVRSLEEAQDLAPKLCRLSPDVVSSLVLRAAVPQLPPRAWVLDATRSCWVDCSTVH